VQLDRFFERVCPPWFSPYFLALSLICLWRPGFALDRALVATQFGKGGAVIGHLQRSIPGTYFLEIPLLANGLPIYLTANDFQELDPSRMTPDQLWELVDHPREKVPVTLPSKHQIHLDALFDDYRIRTKRKASLPFVSQRPGNRVLGTVEPHSLLFEVPGSLQNPPHAVSRIEVRGNFSIKADLVLKRRLPIRIPGGNVSLRRIRATDNLRSVSEPLSRHRSVFSRLVTDSLRPIPVGRIFGACAAEIAEAYWTDVNLVLLPLAKNPARVMKWIH
jgi:hypothetical protein